MIKSNKILQVGSLLVSLLILSSLAIVKQGEWMGYELRAKQKAMQSVSNDTLRTLADGSMVVNTTHLANGITGYGGKVPLEITVKDGKVVHVKALPNNETPDFFNEASTLLNRWNGKTVKEALDTEVDAVSGATFSSKAIIANMKHGLEYVSNHGGQTEESPANSFDCSAKNIIGLAVVLMAAILPIFVKNRKYRLCQLVLNVVVLGFWCGTFLSYTFLIGTVAHGLNVLGFIIPTIMLITAFIYPLFGKKSYYCTNVCPFGSLQQLAGTCVKYKVKMKPTVLHRLDLFRQLVWVVLMLCIWGGVWSEWTDYEPFSAFIFESASWVVFTLAGVFLLLSLIVTRPYCRFVCPMGTLLKISQSSK